MPDKEPSRQAQELASQVERDGGRVLALYQEPVGQHWQIFCLLPRARCEASPYQRDLSPTHVKRLTESIKRLGRFVDPIVVISPRPGTYWTPNGNHRRTVLDKLKADFIPAILVVEPEMVFEVLPLNVEKAHNLKEKSLEVIRMYRALVKEEPEATEESWTFQFESAHFITLGLLYEENKRFAGGAFAPILPRVGNIFKHARPPGPETPTRRSRPRRRRRGWGGGAGGGAAVPPGRRGRRRAVRRSGGIRSTLPAGRPRRPPRGGHGARRRDRPRGEAAFRGQHRGRPPEDR